MVLGIIVLIAGPALAAEKVETAPPAPWKKVSTLVELPELSWLGGPRPHPATRPWAALVSCLCGAPYPKHAGILVRTLERARQGLALGVMRQIAAGA